MKSHAGTPMVVSRCEPPENVFSTRIPNNAMRDYDPARVLDRFPRSGLAGNTQQRGGWEFSGVTPSACGLSLRVVWTDRGHRGGSVHQAIERQVSTRRFRPNHWPCPGAVETGCDAARLRELQNAG